MLSCCLWVASPRQDSWIFKTAWFSLHCFLNWLSHVLSSLPEALCPLTYFFTSIKLLHTQCIPWPDCCSKYDTSFSFFSTNVVTTIWLSWMHFFYRKKKKTKKVHVLLGISASKISSEDISCIEKGWPEIWAWQYVNLNTRTVFSDRSY